MSFPMDMRDVLKCFRNTTISIEVGGAVARSDGFATPSVVETITDVPAVYHPTTGKDLDLLAEGDRIRESLTFYTTQEIVVGDNPSNTSPDVILFAGARYRAVTTPAWAAINGCYVSVCVREEG